MTSLDAYLPVDRRYALLHGEALSDPAQGAALFADISGFTTISAELESQLGAQRGAEAMVGHLNTLFAGLIEQVHRYGGSVIGFSGDAITCWFDAALPAAAGPADSIRRATACAAAMQAIMAEPQATQTAALAGSPLRIKVSVVGGSARRFQVGRAETQTLEVLAGSLLDRLEAAQQVLQPGEIGIGAEALAHFGPELIVGEWRPGPGGEHFGQVAELKAEVAPLPWPELAPLDDQLAKRWLLAPVYERLRQGEGAFLAELRPAVTLFASFHGIDYDGDPRAGEKLHRYICWVQAVLEQYQGFLLQLTIGDKGSYYNVVFGAPVAHEDDPVRAIRAAMALQRLPADLEDISDIQIGLSQGTLLSGAYGGPQRRTYGAIGSETNVAARLMTKAAPGQILVTPRLAAATHQEFEFAGLGAIPLKGLVAPLSVFEVLGQRQVAAEHEVGRQPVGLVGREGEQARLQSLLEKLQGGQSAAAVIEGEAGIGKSHLALAFAEQLRSAGFWVLTGAGDTIEQASAYHAWRPIIREALRANETAVPAAVTTMLDTLPGSGTVEPTAARAASAAALREGNGSGPEEPTLEQLLDILAATHAASSGLALFLDDAQWLDTASWALLEQAYLTLTPLLVVVVTRTLPEEAQLPKPLRTLLESAGTERIVLSTLPPQAITDLVGQRLGVARLPEPVAELIHERAEGNPFYSEELALALLEAGILRIVDGRCVLGDGFASLQALNFPATIQGVITSRIDRLDAATQLTLKVASVIGRAFALRLLSDVHPVPTDRSDLSTHLEDAGQHEITALEAIEPELIYIFKHSLIREVVYGMLLFAQRQQLHQAIGAWLERAHADNLPTHYPLLAHHYLRAVQDGEAAIGKRPDMLEKTFHYLEKAGEQALKNSAYREAVEFFSQALTLAESPAATVDGYRRALWLQQLGEATHQLGRWSEARDHLRQAARLYGQPAPTGRALIALGIAGQLVRQVRNRLWAGRFVGASPVAERETILRVARIHQSLSELSYLTNDLPFSLYAVLVGLNQSERAGPSRELAMGYRDICVIVGLLGRHGAARAYARRAQEVATAVSDPATSAAVLLGIGLYHLNSGQLPDAREKLEAALAESADQRDRRTWGDTVGLLGRVAHFTGDMERAKQLYTQLSQPRSGLAFHRVWSLSSLAGVALRQGRLDDALANLEQAFNLPGAAPDPQQEIVARAYLGLVHHYRGDYEQAREAADRALAMVDASQAQAYNLFEAYGALAEVYLGLWEADQSAETEAKATLMAQAEQACAALQRQSTPPSQAAAGLYGGWYQQLTGRPEQARQRWQKGLAAALEVNMRYEVGRIHYEIGRHLPVDNPERARHLRQARDTFAAMDAALYQGRAEALLADQPN